MRRRRAERGGKRTDEPLCRLGQRNVDEVLHEQALATRDPDRCHRDAGVTRRRANVADTVGVHAHDDAAW
jgi:hypothetical protein